VTDDARSPLGRPTTWTGVLAGLLHAAVLPFYAAAGLLAPGWAVALLLLAWALLAAALVVLVRRRSPLALWFGALTVGEQLLGWTA
jgi:hypothetical protein